MWNTTSWTQILQAKEADTDAIRKIYEDYSLAMEKYLLMKGFKFEDAQDYIQSFFVVFLEKNWINRADKNKGKFRTFLLTLLTRFVRDHKNAKQEVFERGFVHPQENLDRAQDDLDQAELEYHRVWAESLLEIVLDNMRKEIVATNMSMINYEVLWLYFFSGSPILKLGDIKNTQGLLFELLSENKGLLGNIQKSFSLQLQQKLSVANELSIELQKNIVTAINTAFSQRSFYTADFFIKNIGECKLYKKEIKNYTGFIEKIHGGKRACDISLRTVLPKIEAFSSDYNELKKNAGRVIKWLNDVLDKQIFAQEYYDKTPNPKTSNISEIFIAKNRYLLQAFYAEHVPNISLRFNRYILEEAYPQLFVTNIYDDELSYEKLAQHFSTTKSSIQKTISRGSLLYKKLLHEEVSRYTQDENVEEEINDLLCILSKK